MRASEIRDSFLNYFERNGHVIRPSSSLVPGDDPTLLFTNAGMVQFKKVFLGMEDPPEGKRRATTSQKCVRAGGKHNDLEQVGHTARHNTFFEMLGNFSFGDYFKRDAIRFAWEFVTSELGLNPKYLRVSVHHSDDEARALWREIAGLPDSRIYSLGDKDNFWQMADTGPCGPCSEIFVDVAHLAKDWRFPDGASGEWTELDRDEFSLEAFIEGSDRDRFIEFWNLVFMQFDRQSDGTLVPLPRPSVDTGAGLERISAITQGVTMIYHTDLFAPMIAAVEQAVGIPYWGRESNEVRTGVKTRGGTLVTNAVDPASFRVLADHARAVAFLLADGVFPSNDGRGYVLRRILRRAVRHAWLLGRKEPTLVVVVQAVIDSMGDAYPELRQRAQHIVNTTRVEEQGFLDTIAGGLARFDQLAPARTAHGGRDLLGTISGDDAFRLYDTFGFPIDLTELMARERGYAVDMPGFEEALAAQRAQSQEERKSRKLGVGTDAVLATDGEWDLGHAPHAVAPKAGEVPLPSTTFVGYDTVEIETQVTAVRRLPSGRAAVLLRETPFYAESGGQISDHGEIVGDGWRLDVDEVRKVDGRTAAVGALHGDIRFGPAVARVPSEKRRDTERNHTATHLLHAALRQVLGEHVHQAGSVVEPDRLRFDFTHHGPVKPAQLAEIETIVNRGIWASVPVRLDQKPYKVAVAEGAMALFGEKYGDVVRVVSIPGLSVELCGGTHVRNTSEIGLCRILSETGVAAGVRRILAVTGPKAFELLRERERSLERIAERLKVALPAGGTTDALEQRVETLVQEKRTLEKRLDEAMRGGGGDQIQKLLASSRDADGVRLVADVVTAADVKTLQSLGDALRAQMHAGVAALGATFDDGKSTLLVVVTDDMREGGLHADAIVKELAAFAGGRGGGKPHMAQAGIPDAGRLPAALAELPAVVGRLRRSA
jgi:alanyl-tRNA synthetase